MIIDYFILDLKEKKVNTFANVEDSFIAGFNDIKKIVILKTDENKSIILTPENGEDILIEIDETNKIIGYKNKNLTTVGISFYIILMLLN